MGNIIYVKSINNNSNTKRNLNINKMLKRVIIN
jgi:hypothetical protein